MLNGAKTSRRLVVALPALAVTAGLAWFGFTTARVAWLRAEAAAASSDRDWPRAERALERWAWYRPDDVEAIRLRVEAALQRGDRESAARLLAGVPETDPEAASAYLQRGVLLKQLYRVADAEAAFRATARLAPELPEPRRELVALYGITRRAPEQEKELWALHDRADRPVESLRLLAQSAIVIPPGALDRTTDEGDVLRRCLRADPAEPSVRPALARFHRLRGEPDEAARLLESWLRGHPDDPDARVEWLAGRIDAGDVDRPSSWFEAPPGSLSRRADYRQLRGDWLSQQGRHADALADYREAVRLAPRDLECRYRLALGLRGAGMEAESVKAFAYHHLMRDFASAAAGVTETSPAAAPVLAAARACLALGPDRAREAAGWFTLAARLDPSSAEARAGLDVSRSSLARNRGAAS